MSQSPNNPLALYKCRLLSNFEPRRPSNGVQYFQYFTANGVKHFAVQTAVSNVFCAHHVFESPNQFIHHLLWILHPKSERDPILTEHRRFAVFYTKRFGICVNCVNAILETIRFTDIINLYSIKEREENQVSNEDYTEIIEALYTAVMRHPKGLRIIIESTDFRNFKHTKHRRRKMVFKMHSKDPHLYSTDFHYLCHTILANGFIWLSSPDQAAMRKDCERRCDYMRFLWLSLKHWSANQVMCFVGEWLQMFAKFWKSGCERTGMTDGHGELCFILQCFLEGVCRKARKLYSRQIVVCQCSANTTGSMKCIINRILIECSVNATGKERKRYRKEQYAKLVQRAHCGWSECSNTGNDTTGTMKMCGRCKMSYYCSRRCQKKAWKQGHKQCCLKLRKIYCL